MSEITELYAETMSIFIAVNKNIIITDSVYEIFNGDNFTVEEAYLQNLTTSIMHSVQYIYVTKIVFHPVISVPDS